MSVNSIKQPPSSVFLVPRPPGSNEKQLSKVTNDIVRMHEAAIKADTLKWDAALHTALAVALIALGFFAILTPHGMIGLGIVLVCLGAVEILRAAYSYRRSQQITPVVSAANQYVAQKSLNAINDTNRKKYGQVDFTSRPAAPATSISGGDESDDDEYDAEATSY